MTPSLLISLLLATAPPDSVPLDSIRAQRSVGFALAPALTFRDADGLIMPLGLATDWLLNADWGVSAAVARFPVEYTPITHLHLGARRYLMETALSPYLSSDVGLEWDRMEHGGTRRSPFVTGGAGAEWATRGGFLLALDGALGPQYSDVGSTEREWELVARVRLLLGFRL
jgi:hypothetical protein